MTLMNLALLFSDRFDFCPQVQLSVREMSEVRLLLRIPIFITRIIPHVGDRMFQMPILTMHTIPASGRLGTLGAHELSPSELNCEEISCDNTLEEDCERRSWIPLKESALGVADDHHRYTDGQQTLKTTGLLIIIWIGQYDKTNNQSWKLVLHSEA